MLVYKGLAKRFTFALFSVVDLSTWTHELNLFKLVALIHFLGTSEKSSSIRVVERVRMRFLAFCYKSNDQ